MARRAASVGVSLGALAFLTIPSLLLIVMFPCTRAVRVEMN